MVTRNLMTSFAKLTDYPSNSPNIPEDFDKRYLNTYMVMKDTKTGTLFPIWYTGRHNSKYIFTKSDGSYIKCDSKDQIEINTLLPKVGYYNLHNNPYYVVKIPQRQWKRSLCTATYQILSPIKDQINQRLPGSYWFALAQESLNPTYISLDDITIPTFANYALNHKFVVTTDNLSNPILVYKRHKVADLAFKKRSVIVTQPLLLQEVQDLFKYTGVTTWTLHQTQTE